MSDLMLPNIDDVRERIQQTIADHLALEKAGKTGNPYFAYGGANGIDMEVGGVVGRLKVGWFALKPAEQVAAKRAATATSAFATAKRLMTTEEKRAAAEELLADL
jgi:hypothetical protein